METIHVKAQIIRISIALANKLSFLFPDSIYLTIQFYLRMGYPLNLDNPQTFSEKLQWLKLYNRNPLYTTLVDKYAVKEYVVKIIGEKHIIPTIGVWDSPKQIEWDSLPKKFVLKTTHGGGSNGVVVCANKDDIDKASLVKKLTLSLKQDIYNDFREWPYKFVPKRIIAEKFMSQNDGSSLIDYKFFCFNGVPRFVYVSQNVPGYKRSISAFLSTNWELLPFKKKSDSFSTTCPIKPRQFHEMLDIARKLANNIPFVRVDLYEINDIVYFSELTFYPSSGMQPIQPIEWDIQLGELLVLPKT